MGLALALALCFVGQLKAQVPQGLSEGSLQEQFNYMVDESSRYQTYKVVPQTWLNTFWSHVQDTLRANQGALRENRVLINVQKKDIAAFQATEDSLNLQIITLEKEKNSLSLLGIPMDKAAYHVLVWAIIGALAVGLIFFLGRFRYANSVTKKTRKDNQELEETVTHLRKRMLEKEQELRRKLQDEINKHRG
jgi:hypothetical protein